MLVFPARVKERRLSTTYPLCPPFKILKNWVVRLVRLRPIARNANWSEEGSRSSAIVQDRPVSRITRALTYANGVRACSSPSFDYEGCTENQGFAYTPDLPLKRNAPPERGEV